MIEHRLYSIEKWEQGKRTEEKLLLCTPKDATLYILKGYEVFEQDVTLTVNGNYRAWVGLRLPLGEFNKLHQYNADEILNSYKVEDKSQEAYSNLMKEGSNENRNIQ